MAQNPDALTRQIDTLRGRVGEDLTALRRWPEETRRTLEAASPISVFRDLAGSARPLSTAALAGLAALGLIALVGLARAVRTGRRT